MRVQWSKAFLLPLVLLQLQGNVFAADPGVAAFPVYRDKEEGWYWKKDPLEAPKPEEPKKEEPKKAQPKQSKKPAEEKRQSFSVEWLRENMPKLRDRAIDNPTEENVAAYMYAQRVMLDKSQVFAEKAQQVVLGDPLLDEANRMPIASMGRAAAMRGSSSAKDAVLKRLAGVGGIWMFYRSDCGFCEPMAEALITMKMRHGFLTDFIALDNKPIKWAKEWIRDDGQAKALGVKITPTVMFVVPPNNYFIVSQGAMATPEVENRILVAAESHNLLTPEEIGKLFPERRGLMTAEDTQDGATDDPVELVKRIREKIAPKYEDQGRAK